MAETLTVEPAPRSRRPERIRSILPVLVLVILLLVVGVRQPSFLGPPGLRTLIEGSAPLILLALGQMFVILTGGIDLSIAVLTSFGTVLLATWIGDLGVLGILAMVLAITAAGVLNGMVSAYAQVPSFVVTLGAMGVWAGVSLAISGASTISISQNYELIGWLTGVRFAGLIMAVWVALALVAVSALAIRFLARGKALHIIGRAERAALMSGMRTRRVRVFAFGASGLCAALAAMVLASRQYSAAPTLADAMLLPVIAAVILGGTAITGGIGGPLRTLVGALIIGLLRVGMNALGVDPAYEQVVYGAVIIAAVAVTLDRKRIGVVK